MKNRFRRLHYQVSFDRLIIIFASVFLIIALISTGQVRIASLGIFAILVSILFIGLIINCFRSLRSSNPDCLRSQEAINIMTELANKMNVKLHPTKPLEIVPQWRGAKSAPLPFFSGCKVHFAGRVSIGCIILSGLDNLALKGILAHELAHLRKNHSLKVLPFFLLFFLMLVYLGVLQSDDIIPILLTFTTGTLVLSLISWYLEYEADAVAAEYVGKKNMAYALEQVARLIYRPGDTLIHPSFKKRVSRLLSDKE